VLKTPPAVQSQPQCYPCSFILQASLV